jgi:hypothetical protein
MILRKKLESVDLGYNVKILCKTQQSILYKGRGSIAKQALIKHEYSFDKKISLLLNNVY